MKSPGYVQLEIAATAQPEERVCPKCKNPEFAVVGLGSQAECICPECNEEFFPEQALVVNFFADALRIANEKGYNAARSDHIDVLVSHAETLHLRILELDELLAAERSRLAETRQILREVSFQLERQMMVRELVHAG